MYGVIYKLTNKINGKPYVGQTTRTPEERFIDHKHCQTSNIGRAIRKYGAKNFTIEVLEECETAEQLNEREIFWIAYFNCMYPNGYNHATGGQGNWERTPESIAKMSRKGKHHTKETKDKISVALMGENNPNYGKPKTDAEKAQLSAATKNKRQVICVETGEVFESMTAAARAKQVMVQDISRACKNPGRTAAGCHWRPADEPQTEISTNSEKTKPRPVICVETGEVFESIIVAGRQYYISPRCIARACKSPAFTSCGCHWQFKEVEPQTETSATSTEIKPDNEASAKTSAGKIGKPLSDEHKATLSAAIQTKKPVICVETGVIYESITEASRLNNIKHSNIKRACQIPHRRAGGYHWMFKDAQPSDVPTESQTSAGTPTPKHLVICVETNEIFESITAAARNKNLRVTNISRACRNQRNTAGGCHWKFVDEPTN